MAQGARTHQASRCACSDDMLHATCPNLPPHSSQGCLGARLAAEPRTPGPGSASTPSRAGECQPPPHPHPLFKPTSRALQSRLPKRRALVKPARPRDRSRAPSPAPRGREEEGGVIQESLTQK
eukprot:scaffold6934_cov121-Isochrysis_galbana.AAC.13